MKNYSGKHFHSTSTNRLQIFWDYLLILKDVRGKRQPTSTIYINFFFNSVVFLCVFWHTGLYYLSLLFKKASKKILLPYLMQYFLVSVANSKWLILHCFFSPRNANLSPVESAVSASSLLSTGVVGGPGVDVSVIQCVDCLKNSNETRKYDQGKAFNDVYLFIVMKLVCCAFPIIYSNCQVVFKFFLQLTSMKLTVSWLEIFAAQFSFIKSCHEQWSGTTEVLKIYTIPRK